MKPREQARAFLKELSRLKVESKFIPAFTPEQEAKILQSYVKK